MVELCVLFRRRKRVIVRVYNERAVLLRSQYWISYRCTVNAGVLILRAWNAGAPYAPARPRHPRYKVTITTPVSRPLFLFVLHSHNLTLVRN